MLQMTRFIMLLVISAVTLVFSQHNYREALHKTTYYYGAQRCGDTKSWIHEACHTRDGERDGIDLTGGWHDCGDHVKFGQTNGYAAALMLHSFFRR